MVDTLSSDPNTDFSLVSLSHRRHEALTDGSSGTGRSVATRQGDGLPEPRIKQDKDKLEVQMDVSEYRWVTKQVF